MSTDRTWEIERDRFSHMCHPPLEMGECVSVVEESRLREAEAESEKRQVLIDVCCKNHDRQVERAHVAEARAEELESRLAGVADALQEYVDTADRPGEPPAFWSGLSDAVAFLDERFKSSASGRNF